MRVLRNGSFRNLLYPIIYLRRDSFKGDSNGMGSLRSPGITSLLFMLLPKAVPAIVFHWKIQHRASTDPSTENDSFNTENNTAGQFPALRDYIHF